MDGLNSFVLVLRRCSPGPRVQTGAVLFLFGNPGVDAAQTGSNDADAASGLASLIAAIEVNTTLERLDLAQHNMAVDAALADTEGRRVGRARLSGSLRARASEDVPMSQTGRKTLKSPDVDALVVIIGETTTLEEGEASGRFVNAGMDPKVEARQIGQTLGWFYARNNQGLVTCLRRFLSIEDCGCFLHLPVIHKTTTRQ
jgi:hypothetical protein